jgi:hypothetical protein
MIEAAKADDLFPEIASPEIVEYCGVTSVTDVIHLKEFAIIFFD